MPNDPPPANGSRATLRFGTRELACEAVEASGFALGPADAGGATITLARLVLRRAHVVLAAGAIDVDLITLTGVEARVTSMAEGRPPELLECTVRELRIEGVHGFIGGFAGSGRLSGDVRLDAVSALEGTLRAFVTDAVLFIDATITVPITQGGVDFNAVRVEHVGPDSALVLDANGVRLRRPSGITLDLLLFPPAPSPGALGVTPERPGDRGRLALQPFMEAELTLPPGVPRVRFATPNLQGALQRTSLTGELALGDGPLAALGHELMLTGRAQGRNRIEISSPAVEKRVIARIADFAAQSATFALGDRRITVANLGAALEVHLVGSDAQQSAPRGPRIAIAITRATLQQLALRRVT